MKKNFLILFTLCLLPACSSLTLKAPTREQKYFLPSWNKNHDPSYDSGNLPIGLSAPYIDQGILFMGHDEGFMKAYDVQNGRLLWQQFDGGRYHAPPIAYKNLIVYGNDQGRVFARNAAFGELIYAIDLGASVETQGVVYKDRIFFHLRNHQIVSLDASTGKILWTYKRSVPFTTTLQKASRPLLLDNKIFVGHADGMVVAMNMEDGSIIWETKLASGQKFIDVDMTPTFYQDKLIVGSLAGEMSVLSPENGSILRRLAYNASRPLVPLEGLLYFGTVDGKVVALNKDLNVVKEISLDSKGLISSIAPWRGGLVVSSSSGQLWAMDKGLGEIKEHREMGHSSSSIFGPVEVDEDRLAVFSSRNRLYVFQ